jgi:hypothetical protein
MHHIIKKIQEKPHHQRLMYFWTITSISVIFTIGIWLSSLNGLIGNLAESPDNDKVKKTFSGLSSISQEIKDLSGKTKASFYEATKEFSQQAEQAEQAERIEQIKNKKEADPKIPNRLPINQ